MSTWTSRACAIPSRCQIRVAPDKAHDLGAVVANFRSAGARCVVVSGVVDAAYRVHADMIPRAALTVCRLRAGCDSPGARNYRIGAGRAALTSAQWTRAMLETCGSAPVPCRWPRWRGLTRERRVPSLRPPLTPPDGFRGGCPVLGAGRCWPGDLAPMTVPGRGTGPNPQQTRCSALGSPAAASHRRAQERRAPVPVMIPPRNPLAAGDARVDAQSASLPVDFRCGCSARGRQCQDR
jgi:hypothetical protein